MFDFCIRQLKYAKFLCVFLFLFTFCQPADAQLKAAYNKNIRLGADQLETLLPLLKDKKVGVCGNQTSVLSNGTHVVDTLLARKVGLVKIYTPEHGLRGKADAGERVGNATDVKTGLPVISLYGKNKKPSVSDLNGIDIMLFDLQDVGARFYTYISTLHYLMEACAENKVSVIVLDRPNPNGFYVDGPVLDTSLRSFIGMHPIPIVHGMTIGEYAQMINGEGWMKNRIVCPLTVITCKNYTHSDYYELPVNPSPNLTSMQAIFYYPSTCLFEGTAMSVGRGTQHPFRNIAMPGFKKGNHYFTPQATEVVKEPVLKGKKCRGFFISDSMVNTLLQKPQIDLELLLYAYRNSADKTKFFTEKGSFNILAGTTQLKKQVLKGVSAHDIRKSWEPGLTQFKQTRKKYLLYPDYE